VTIVKRSGSKRQPSRLKLESAAQDASRAVRQAASVLEAELATGLAGVRKVETRFTKERRVEQKDFDEILEQARQTTHQLIDVASGRVADLRSDEFQDISSRLTSDAHDLFDTMINMVGMAPDVINRLAARAEKALPEAAPRKTSRATGASARSRNRRSASE
jgi:hypothetical protein